MTFKNLKQLYNNITKMIERYTRKFILFLLTGRLY